jgi:3,4-dihydroxy-2-butanone 4-phosphate synthase
MSSLDAILNAVEVADLESMKKQWNNEVAAELAGNPDQFANLLQRASRHPVCMSFVLANTVASAVVAEPSAKRVAGAASLNVSGFAAGIEKWNELNGKLEKAEDESKKVEESEAEMVKRVEAALDIYRKGEFLVVFDAKDRENEGDLIIAAEFCTPEKVAFMIRHCSGLICTPCNAERLQELDLPLMVPANDHSEYHGTAFTVSFDLHHKHGTTTGISATDRSSTIKALAQPEKYGKSDFVRPGHIFPLRSRDGGVIVRGGHTEAGTDLCTLAGLYPAAAICEINKLDGSMSRYADLEVFAKQYNLTLISIEDIVAYRKLKESKQ